MSTELRQALERVARRFRHLRLWVALALCWFAWALAGAGVVWSQRGAEASALDRRLPLVLLALAAVTGLACAAWALRSARDRRWVARRIEARHPELGTGLLAAVEQDAASAGRIGFLQSAVLRDAVLHGRLHDWEETVPTWALRGSKLAHAAALAFLFVVCFTLVSQARSRSGDGPAAGADAAAGVRVEPGDAEVERGTSLLVVARFAGAVPAEAALVVADDAGAETRRTMTRSLEDPAFAGRVESVERDLAYFVEFPGGRSETYRVTVFEYPEVLRADARLVFPGYTSLEPKTVEDVRHVTAVEGTELTLLCRLNKPVATARLVDEQGRAIDLAPSDEGEHAYRATFTLTEPRRLRVELVDADGRPNKSPFEIAVNVVRNRPAAVKSTRPARDMRVSPLEELSLAAELDDDFGVVRHGVSYAIAGEEPREIVLDAPGPNRKRLEAAHLLDFESLAAEPDQLVTYYFWAEDVGPDGEPRRTSGDMFFAEVRPFEEIFRQGQQPPGGGQQQGGRQGGNAQDAMRLAELQKEIVNATWGLIRRETGPEVSEKFQADADLLAESQRSAIEQAGRLAERLQDPTSKAELARATEFMDEAATRLDEAGGSSDAAALTPALSAEQAAYQALLKLRDREFEVVRNDARQQGGGSSAGGPSQQQLQQLELSNDENRYEERRSAGPEELSREEQQQREDRQVLNRLRELARRQEDLNERLKELRSALEAAEDEQEREEIERQLKRLRDQQQQILRDTDELRERMEREENRDRMAEAREQVERSREHVRQASEALEEGRLSQALTEGTRAGRRLDELREEFRRQTSERFSEEMTSMRDDARRLSETQDELTERLDAAEQSARRSLRDDGERRRIRADLEAQRQRLDELTERMRQTVQEAEETEPLLAEKLYDAVREADSKSIPDALEAAERLTDLGVPEEAAKASRHAGEGLRQLREGVEQAAESVLGDETEALRRAGGELEELAEQIEREIAEATGREPGGRDGERDGNGSSARQPDRDDDEASRRPQEGGTEPGERPSETGERGASGEPSSEENRQGEQGGAAGDRQGREPRPEQGNERPGQDGSGQQSPQEESPQGRRQGGGQGDRNAPQAGQERQGGQPGSLRGGSDEPRPGGAGERPSGLDRLLEGLSDGGPAGPGGPITGEGFVEWSDRLRDVEELLDDPDLRAEAARIRDRARGAREEYKRHAKEPDWTKLDTLVAEPIRELRDRVAEEVRRRESPDALVPIDRDPVPPAFAEDVRRYYERLGSGR